MDVPLDNLRVQQTGATDQTARIGMAPQTLPHGREEDRPHNPEHPPLLAADPQTDPPHSLPPAACAPRPLLHLHAL